MNGYLCPQGGSISTHHANSEVRRYSPSARGKTGPLSPSKQAATFTGIEMYFYLEIQYFSNYRWDTILGHIVALLLDPHDPHQTKSMMWVMLTADNACLETAVENIHMRTIAHLWDANNVMALCYTATCDDIQLHSCYKVSQYIQYNIIVTFTCLPPCN